MRLPTLPRAARAAVAGASLLGAAALAACAPEEPPQTTIPRLSESGTLFGVLLESGVGPGIRTSDLELARDAAERAHQARIGGSVEWANPETGNRGSVTAIREGFAQNGAFCREYRQAATVAGRTEQVFGIVCRQPDGAWRLASS
jgi:surface antigen